LEKVNPGASAATLTLDSYLKLGRLNDHVLTVIRTEERVLDFHVHERSDEMFYVIEGTMGVEFDDGVVTLEAGEFVVVPAGARHRPVCHAPVTCLLIEKDGTLTGENTGGAL
jgi:mannose-6-phosphate isomerase-like protein (cupin superfamily)